MSIYSKIVTPAADMQLINDIVTRVQEEFATKRGYSSFDVLGAVMDLELTHYFYPLRLEALKAAMWSHLIHDIAGIKKHLNRDTGELRDGWTPRYIDSENPAPMDITGLVMSKGKA